MCRLSFSHICIAVDGVVEWGIACRPGTNQASPLYIKLRRAHRIVPETEGAGKSKRVPVVCGWRTQCCAWAGRTWAFTLGVKGFSVCHPFLMGFLSLPLHSISRLFFSFFRRIIMFFQNLISPMTPQKAYKHSRMVSLYHQTTNSQLICLM